MRKRKRKPVYSAKATRPTSVGQIISDTGWLNNPFGGESRTVVERAEDGYNVRLEFNGYYILPPTDQKPGGVLNFEP
jgi:hypothetical protein